MYFLFAFSNFCSSVSPLGLLLDYLNIFKYSILIYLSAFLLYLLTFWMVALENNTYIPNLSHST